MWKRKTSPARSLWWCAAVAWRTSEPHGLMDIESKRPMVKNALFRLASTSKPVTAAAVLILREEGKLRLTDPVAKYIPEFKNSKVAVAAPPGSAERYTTAAANHDITILDLLTHTSGLGSSGLTNSDFA